MRTTIPRDFALTTGPDAVALAQGSGGAPDIALPAEAFIRLVDDLGLLDALRGVFPGP